MQAFTQVRDVFRLLRWSNLLFIVITQALFFAAVYHRLFPGLTGWWQAAGLIAASVCIAAGGYAINDYFDQNIDRINKPDRTWVGRSISGRTAIALHSGLTLLGIGLTAVSIDAHRWFLLAANIGAALLLWLYSTSLKRKAVVGNVTVALLTAWTIGMFYFLQAGMIPSHGVPAEARFVRIAMVYAGFAFVVTLVREAVKDLEDLEGDRRWGCATLPIVAGMPAAKLFAGVWLSVLCGALAVMLVYVAGIDWWGLFAYLLAFVLLPSMMLFPPLYRAATPKDFGQLSRRLKWITLSGILSLLFFYLYI